MSMKVVLAAALVGLVYPACCQIPGYYPVQPTATPVKHLWNIFQKKTPVPQQTPYYVPTPIPTAVPTPRARSAEPPSQEKPAKKPSKDMYNMPSGSKTASSAKTTKDSAKENDEKAVQSSETPKEYTGDSFAPESAPGKTPMESEPGKVVVDWPTGHKLIALTFDDGPNPTYTPKLIEVLKEKDVKATFFLLGEQIKAYSKVATKLGEEGFEIGNHTYDHKQLNKLSGDQVESELSRTQELITSATGSPPKTMRPPYGEYRAKDHHVVDVCNKMGYPIILWDVDTNDWRTGKGAQSEQAMISNILKNSHDGSIILMHDRYQKSVNATAAVIEPLRKQGYEFVTISELLSYAKVSTARTAASDEVTSKAVTRKRIVLPQ